MLCAVVSGISGHLGQELARQLVHAGVNVVGLTRQAATATETSPGSVRCHRVDGRTETLISALDDARPDVVFHLAGLSRRQHLSGDITAFVESNVLFGTQLLEAARVSGCKRFITAGSYLQYFNTDQSRSFNLYAATKEAFERIVEYYTDAFGIASVRLTLCDIYSENDVRPKLINDISAAWSRGSSLLVHEDDPKIDPVHVSDAAAAFMRAAALLEENPNAARTMSRYSVTSGRDVSLRELLTTFERLGGRKIAIERSSNRPARSLIRSWRGAILPGWVPRVTIEDGVARILSSRAGTDDQYLDDENLRGTSTASAAIIDRSYRQ
jgi:nucleoside-diphosphate-sugar epimerase